MKINSRYILTLFVLLFMLVNVSRSQDKAFVYMEFFNTWKYNDNSRGLKCKLIAETDDGEAAAQGLVVNFYTVGEEDNTLVAEAVTDGNGVAEAIFPAGYDFPKDEDAYIHVKASFEGNENYEMTEEELSFKDVNISFSFNLVDDEKQIQFKGEVLGPDNEILPLADDDIYFYVPRMFSELKIADGWFEENGEGYVEFPPGIIGDSLGKVQVIARLTDHFDYGNVMKSEISDWAVPMHPHLRQLPGRELWTPIAPLWMIITLIITLSGVWGHYIYAVVQLYRIKKLAKKQKSS